MCKVNHSEPVKINELKWESNIVCILRPTFQQGPQSVEVLNVQVVSPLFNAVYVKVPKELEVSVIDSTTARRFRTLHRVGPKVSSPGQW